MFRPSRGKSIIAGLILAFVFGMAGCSQNPSANEQKGLFGGLLESSKPITISEGTALTVVLDQSLSSAENRSGDTFQASVAEPIVVEGKTVIPKDARVEGRVVDANPSGRLKGVARLALALDSVEVNGKKYDLDTTDSSHYGHNHNKRNAEWIGGGAAGGALIGGLAGGGKGALIGAAVGAGAGTAGAAYTGKKDIHIPAESHITFRLTKPVTIPVKG